MQPSTTTDSGADGKQRAPWTAKRNLPYKAVEAHRATDLACLDLFFSGHQRGQRVVVYVHGGRWIGGDKSEIEEYPRMIDFFIRNDCVVASVNFSVTRKGNAPSITYKDQARDIAAAIKWLAEHVEDYGGRPEGFILLGYSSGAHLAALVALDERYLVGQGMDGDLVRCVIAMDVHAYDIPAALALMEDTPLEANIPLMTALFGGTRAEQEVASPSSYLATAGKKMFLLFSCALSGSLRQTVSGTISESFKEKLIAHGHEAIHEHLEHDGHRSILSRFGSRFDGVSEKIKVFLDVEAGTHWALQNRRERIPGTQPSRDLKLEAVRVAEITDRSAAEIAREFGVRVGEIYAWKKEFKKQGKMSASLRGGTSGPGPLTGATGPQTGDAEFSEEFKREAVRLWVSSGRSAVQIARELEVPLVNLYQWKKKFEGSA